MVNSEEFCKDFRNSSGSSYGTMCLLKIVIKVFCERGKGEGMSSCFCFYFYLLYFLVLQKH